MYAGMYNLLSPFSIAGMDMCPGLTIWSVDRELIPEGS